MLLKHISESLKAQFLLPLGLSPLSPRLPAWGFVNGTELNSQLVLLFLQSTFFSRLPCLLSLASIYTFERMVCDVSFSSLSNENVNFLF